MRDNREERDRVQETILMEGRLGSLILSLHLDGSTGTLGIKEGERDLKLYFEKGRLAYAGGIDKEGPLLVELVSKGKINLKQMDEFRVISQKNPLSLGQALLVRKVVSEALWRQFLLLKATSVLTAAFDMERPDLLYSDSEPSIPPVNFVHEESLPFVLDTIRSTTPRASLREILKTGEMVFGLSSDISSLGAALPLNPSEEKTLSMINGRRTAKEILNSSGLTSRLFQKSLYCLIRLGLVDKVSQQQSVSREHTYIIRLYLNLLLIVDAAYRQEIGKRSQKVFKACVADLPPPGKALLSDLDLVNENLESAAKKISAHLLEQRTLSDERLVLLTSFSKLLYLLITRKKKLLGKKRAMRTIQEMIRALVHFDPGKKHPETMLYAKKNLEDIARQMQS
jgi:Domain of unknown function (DUF4388)